MHIVTGGNTICDIIIILNNVGTIASSAVECGCIGGVMVSVLASSVVDCVIASSAVDCECIGGVMVIVLASSVVDCGFEPRSGHTKDYEIGICCFSAKHAA
jgi:hypothetical protein